MTVGGTRIHSRQQLTLLGEEDVASRSARPGRTLDAFSELVHRIYEAGLEPALWTGVVRQVANSLGASKGLLFTPRLAPHHGGLVFPAGIEEHTLLTWATHFIDKDVWTQAAIRKDLFRTNICWTDADLVPERELVRSSFYTHFLSHIDIHRVCAGTIFGEGPAMPTTALSVFRGEADPPFDDDDLEWMRRLVPHLSRSVGLMMRLDMQGTQIASTRAAFDRLPFGVALLDEDMQVVHCNAAARDVMSRGDGLMIDAGNRLESRVAGEESGSLSRWLEDVRDLALPQPHFCDGFQVERHGVDAPCHYLVQCVPIAPPSAWAPAEGVARYVIFISDPAATELPTIERLIALYSLTRAQARAALALALGGSYKSVARELGVSEETVRSHVKEIYPKLRVNRQADLVRLLLSLGRVRV
jgi:DNA-binding CsgD family transcriptional regulator